MCKMIHINILITEDEYLFIKSCLEHQLNISQNKEEEERAWGLLDVWEIEKVID